MPFLATIRERVQRLLVLFYFDNWFQLLVTRLLWPGSGPNIYRKNGLEILIDHSTGDQDGTRSCIVPGLYNPCFDALASLPKQLRVLDLGANGGGFVLALQHQGYQIVEGLLVELNPHTWSRLVLNVYRNIPEAKERLTILNGAASAFDGEVCVSLGRGSVADSIAEASGQGNYRLPTWSLATLMNKFKTGETIDLCKIDIEGAEYLLFQGVSRELLRRIRWIIMEIHQVSGASSEELKSYLAKEAGFIQIQPPSRMIEQNVYLFQRDDSQEPAMQCPGKD